MEWTEDHDLCLSQEILSLDLLKRKREVLREETFGTRLPIILTPWKFQGLEFQSVQ